MSETTSKPIVSPYLYPGLELNGKRCLFQKEVGKTQVEDVASMVCDYYKINDKVFYSRFRGKINIADARKIVCYLSHRFLHISLCAIGDVINRDHSSVSNNIKAAENLISSDNVFANDVYYLTARLFN